MSSHLLRFIACASIGLVGGCAGRIKADDMSANEHLAIAATERSRADAEKRAYDPSKTVRTTEVDVDAAAAGGAAVVRTESNPTDVHLDVAQKLDDHAKAHEKAAAALEKFESKECVGLSKAERSACPLIGLGARIEDTKNGIRLYMADNASVAQTAAVMRCHYAFAEARGFDDSVSCPLYIKGIKIELSRDGKSVELNAKSKAVVTELQRRGHAAIKSTVTNQGSEL